MIIKSIYHKPISASCAAICTAALISPSILLAEEWKIETQEAWEKNKSAAENLEIKDATATPSGESAIYKSVMKTFEKKRSAKSITISQTPTWLNWEPSEQIGPANMNDAPVALRLGEDNYWIFAKYGTGAKKVGKVGKGKKTAADAKKEVKTKEKKEPLFVAEEATLEGFDIPLKTTRFKNQYDAPGASEKHLGGYHAWQSKDMVNWVHHGPVSDTEARWMTTAEQVGDKTYFYYDFPNDQDPHLIIDDDLTDGKMGKKMGMAFKDPSHGSDSAIIRDLEGKFHLILENWDPIKASVRSWDSPLASHAVSDNGIDNFKLLEPAVDYRTEPTGKKDTFKHPHWAKEDPANYKSGVAEYEIYKPEQEAYGDWAAIAIGGQYYLFGDYDPVGAHGAAHMKTCWFTASDINKPFKFCGKIGTGHPDPDIIFAEGKFHLISQTDDFTSTGPWVDGVEVRVGVDTDNDKTIDKWTEWTTVKESYSEVKGFAKQVATAPAKADLSSLPDGHGFQFEVRLTDKTKNDVKPVLDQISLEFAE